MPPRFAKKVDSNQPCIVKDLRSIPGVTVETDHDDIIVGFRGATYWYEIKSPSEVARSGKIRQSALKPSQKKLLRDFTGHYRVVWSLGQILDDLGVTIVSP